MQIWLRDQIWTILESWNQLFQHLCSAVGQAISQQKQKHCSPKLIQNIRVNHGLKFQILFNNICIVKQIISNALNISENSATRMGFEPWDEQEVSKVFGKCIRYDIHLFTLSYSTLSLQVDSLWCDGLASLLPDSARCIWRLPQLKCLSFPGELSHYF